MPQFRTEDDQGDPSWVAVPLPARAVPIPTMSIMETWHDAAGTPWLLYRLADGEGESINIVGVLPGARVRARAAMACPALDSVGTAGGSEYWMSGRHRFVVDRAGPCLP